MIYFILPTLLTAGLLWWIFDDDGDGSDEGQDEPQDRDVALTQGNDTFVGTDANETISAYGGKDDVSGNGGDDILKLAWGNDSGAGGAGDDELNGGAGNDVLNGGPGNDVIRGGPGSDIVGSFSKAVDRFVSAGGNLWMTEAEASSAKAFLDRDGNSDLGNDTINGGDGNDFLTDFAGDNSISGGIGMDFISTLDSGSSAGAGVDTLDGGFGKDVLQGDDGDIMTGGAGIDTFSVVAAATAERAVQITDFEPGESIRIYVEGAKATDQLTVQTEGSTAKIMLDDRVIATVNNIDTAAKLASLKSAVVLTNTGATIGSDAQTSGDDSYTGTSGNDQVDMLAGNDTAYGAGGNDQLTLGAGNDVASGQDGADTVSGGAGTDLISGGVGNDQVSGDDDTDILSKSSAYLGKYGESLGLSAAQVSTLNSKIGDSKFDDGGNDTLDGGAGNDLITDFAGDNLLRGGAGNDVISALDSGAGAGSGADTIDGGDGNDRLEGDDGDVMTGGAGTDSFVVQYEQPGDASVTITDFQPGESITLNVANPPVGATLDFTLAGGKAVISLSGVQLASVNNVADAAQLAQVQAATNLVSIPA